ncbi:hypothetical protein RCH23_000503 [Cryobacterium sp. CAN_C3]|nr:hypothetical protein [Cryobacterium sp. CAN_C3]
MEPREQEKVGTRRHDHRRLQQLGIIDEAWVEVSTDRGTVR